MPEIPQISLGTAAILIFLVCAAYVLLRGMMRMMAGTLVLAASLWLGFQTWQLAPQLSIDWTGDLSALITHGLPPLVTIAAFFLLRAVAAAITRPFGPKPGEDAPAGPRLVRRMIRLPLAIIPAAVLWLIGAVFVHHAGSIAEIRAVAEQTGTDDAPNASPWLARLKESVSKTLPKPLLAWLDPLAEPGRLNLAKWIASLESAPAGSDYRSALEPMIDPATGRPIPRAIIVDDPDLQDLARDGSFGTLLRHPSLTRALQDPELREAIERLRP